MLLDVVLFDVVLFDVVLSGAGAMGRGPSLHASISELHPVASARNATDVV